MTESLAGHWDLDPEVHFLNHGSFGACPRTVLDRQSELRRELEREPVRFMARELPAKTDHVRSVLGRFINAHPDDLVLVPNATTGVNTVLRSIAIRPGDEILVTDHEYNACRNALDHTAQRRGASVVVAKVPFPLPDPKLVVEAIVAKVRKRTRLLLVDHVTSQTGLVLPIADIIQAMAKHSVDVLVDGAHALGMLDLDLGSLRPTYYTSNAHKWLCTPKGAAFLYVRRDKQEQIQPLVISHGANAPLGSRSRFRHLFDWTGTDDPTPWLCIPAALEFLQNLMPGGLAALRARNKSLVLAGRKLLCDALGIQPPAPESMIGSLASVPLPDGENKPPRSSLYQDPLQDELMNRYQIEVPIMPWPAPPRRLLRISAQAYNDEAQYRLLADALRGLLG